MKVVFLVFQEVDVTIWDASMALGRMVIGGALQNLMEVVLVYCGAHIAVI